MSFLVISLAFVTVAVMRLLSLNWYNLTGEYLDQNLFGLLTYFVPDVVVLGDILIVQIQLFAQYRAAQKRRYKGSEDEMDFLVQL